MDEIELIEKNRWPIFVVGALMGFVLCVWLTGEVLSSAVLAIGFGLFLSGYRVAKQLTSEVPWAYLEAEGRINGKLPSKRGVWVGNLIPGLLFGILGLWLLLHTISSNPTATSLLAPSFPSAAVAQLRIPVGGIAFRASPCSTLVA
ncbi:hypothetical protein AACH06_29720 [Ideonella sp. DXS29W]|uniref:Uncharacterized protein n=1 Tax=Ideonella lacteola TaxID=2984193 RepID=A0ABU9C2D5_9BURK